MVNDRFIFRAWDKAKKQWRDDFFIDPFGRYRVFVDDDGDKNGLHEHDESSLHDLIIVQSTGLRDRAGKLIFEGDIVRRMVIDWDNTPEDYEDGKEAMREIMRDVVTLNRLPVYWLESESFGYEGEDLESPEDSEIIGNIYEHPELLKG